MLDSYLRNAEILLVDDNPSDLLMLQRILERAGLGVPVCTTDPREVLQLCLWREPELILLDLRMPHTDGIAVLRELSTHFAGRSAIPVVVITADATSDAREAAFAAGARDFLTKPLDGREVVLRVRNQIEIRHLQREIQQYSGELELKVWERTRELQEAQVEMMERLARAAEYRDDDTGEHAKRVGEMSARIADRLGLPLEQVELIWRAATLHDVGKIGIEDAILLKPGRLTPEEMAVIRRHTRIGAEILSNGRSPYLRMAERIALTHHERWDGTGYMGLSGEDIPIEGRIVAVADVFDALTHARPYKPAWSTEDAVAHMQAASGTHFDPPVVVALLSILREDGRWPIADAPDPASPRMVTRPVAAVSATG